MQNNFDRKPPSKNKIFICICALMQCRLVIHIAINLEETCYQQKTINKNGFVYILMALGRIKKQVPKI